MSRPDNGLRDRAEKLGLYGLVTRWGEMGTQGWVQALVEAEEQERQRRSLERRIHRARLGRFKPMADFDWKWPKEIDQELVRQLLTVDFLGEAANVVIFGPNGVGKTMIAENLAHEALLRGHTALRVTASEMLNDLAAMATTQALGRRLKRYVNPALLVCDEVGYLTYDSRHGDLLFEVISRRHLQRSTVITTNKSFREWEQVFANAGCITALVDRLTHKAEIVRIDGESYRKKEALERAAAKSAANKKRKNGGGNGARS